ncbi:MAG: 16S rRNA (cytosine(1402)-N(4))-methyltransferase RsmH [Thermodesulfobacteriota bacterium]
MTPWHEPVLVEEVLHWLAPHPGGIYLDGTLGLAGHARRILEACDPDGRLVGLDWDGEALAEAQRRLQPFAGRVYLARRSCAAMAEVLAEAGIAQVDGVLLDLGLSSLQLDASSRGFSFRQDQPLDMRMDDRGGQTAADLLAELPEAELADLLASYGEERYARRIARSLAARRRLAPIRTSAELSELVRRAVPRPAPGAIHPATRTFQALRMAVNRELEQVDQALSAARQVLAPGGRCLVISFHSLEDRLVKTHFRDQAAWQVLTRKPVTPAAEEKAANPRSRSAKLRVAARAAGRLP